MRTCDTIQCTDFPCTDVCHECYNIPAVDLQPDAVRILLISEAVPQDRQDDYYAGSGSLFERTTLQAFADAGYSVNSIAELLGEGIYFTERGEMRQDGLRSPDPNRPPLLSPAGKRDRPVPQCAGLPADGGCRHPGFETSSVSARAMGVVIPAGATYKIRGGQFTYHSRRALPSYLQAGPSFFIEKSKRRMIAADIGTALSLSQRST